MICEEFIESIKDASAVADILKKDKRGTCLENKAVWQYAQLADEGKAEMRDFLKENIGGVVMRTIEEICKLEGGKGHVYIEEMHSTRFNLIKKLHRFYWSHDMQQNDDDFMVASVLVEHGNLVHIEKLNLCAKIYNAFPDVRFSEIACVVDENHQSDESDDTVRWKVVDESDESDDTDRWKVVTKPPSKKKRKGGLVKEFLKKL
jgi:hypothetical protein